MCKNVKVNKARGSQKCKAQGISILQFWFLDFLLLRLCFITSWWVFRTVMKLVKLTGNMVISCLKKYLWIQIGNQLLQLKLLVLLSLGKYWGGGIVHCSISTLIFMKSPCIVILTLIWWVTIYLQLTDIDECSDGLCVPIILCYKATVQTSVAGMACSCCYSDNCVCPTWFCM